MLRFFLICHGFCVPVLESFFLQMMHVNCSCTMSDRDLVSYIIKENKIRKKRRIVLTELYFESVCLGLHILVSKGDQGS